MLHGLLPASNTPSDKIPSIPRKEDFLDRVKENMIFVPHPLIKVHTVFYLKQQKEIVFLKEIVGGCGKFNTKDQFDLPQIDDAAIIALINLFGCRESLREIYLRFCAANSIELNMTEFFDIVWLLNKHNIILNSSNFEGMLEGMGGLG